MGRILLMCTMTYTTKTFSQKEISQIAQEIVAGLRARDCATIVALSGDLGAGKTTLTQSIARELGIQENVISPTFVIMKNYIIKNSQWNNFVHIDAYRLNSCNELLNLGWNELINNPKNLILIEWPEKVQEIIPQNARNIFLSHKNEDEREISF